MSNNLSLVNFRYGEGYDLLDALAGVSTTGSILLTVSCSVVDPSPLLKSLIGTRYNYCMSSSHSLSSPVAYYADPTRTIPLIDTTAFLINNIPLAKLIFNYAKVIRPQYTNSIQPTFKLNVASTDSTVISIASHVLADPCGFIDFPTGLLTVTKSILQLTSGVYICESAAIARSGGCTLLSQSQ